MEDVMIDIETLGTRGTSAIVQIGACYFSRRTGQIGKTFSMNVHVGVLDERFTRDESTLKWWDEQSEEAKAAVFNNGKPIETVLKELSSFLKNRAKFLWSHATFDIPIICNSYYVLDMHLPMHYKQMRDIRTLLDLAGIGHSNLKREGIHHNALDDCKFQVQYCVEAFKALSK